jgi:transcriptional regulator of arginine metabolism
LREIGIAATQSSISRDLQELGIKRVKGRYVLKPWREVGAGDFEGILGFIQHVRPSGPYLTVIATSPNAAQMVADAMESENWPEVSGTLAGSDTIFVATATREDLSRLLDRFRVFLKRSGPPGVDHADRPPEREEEAAEAEDE